METKSWTMYALSEPINVQGTIDPKQLKLLTVATRVFDGTEAEARAAFRSFPSLHPGPEVLQYLLFDNANLSLPVFAADVC